MWCFSLMNLFKDEGKKEKESPVVPQPKPPRQPPEVKPKPQMCASAPVAASTSTPASEHHEEEEEEEDNKFMKELQVCGVISCFLTLKQIKYSTRETTRIPDLLDRACALLLDHHMGHSGL